MTTNASLTGYPTNPQIVTLAWILRRLLIGIAILVVMMGGTAWLMHTTIDPALEADHRKQFTQPDGRSTTNTTNAGYYEPGYSNGGEAPGHAAAAASVAIPAAAAAVVRSHATKN